MFWRGVGQRKGVDSFSKQYECADLPASTVSGGKNVVIFVLFVCIESDACMHCQRLTAPSNNSEL